MEKLVSFDKQGRIYVPEEIRKKILVKTLIARVVDSSILLEPIEEDPIKALGKLGSSKLKGKSIKKLKKEAREELEKNAFKKIR